MRWYHRVIPVVLGCVLFAFIVVNQSKKTEQLGDHGDRVIITIDQELKSIRLACPVYESEPIGAHGRECYVIKGEEDGYQETK